MSAAEMESQVLLAAHQAMANLRAKIACCVLGQLASRFLPTPEPYTHRVFDNLEARWREHDQPYIIARSVELADALIAELAKPKLPQET